MNTDTTRVLLCLFASCSMTVTGATHGQVYKWLDEKGVVNYGSEPPKRASAKALPPEASTVTIIPGPASVPKTDGREQELEKRLARTEQELEQEKRGRTIAAQAQADAEAARQARLREQCERERRIDCDADPYGARYDAVVIYPQPRYPYRVQPRLPLNPVTVQPGAQSAPRTEKSRTTAGTHVRSSETKAPLPR
jgi:hypothetical protein